jgi:hypothetical protein
MSEGGLEDLYGNGEVDEDERFDGRFLVYR